MVHAPATKRIAAADAGSTHWRSSTRTSTGARSAVLANIVNVPAAIRKRSAVTVAGPHPSAPSTALRPGEVLDPAADRCEQFE